MEYKIKDVGYEKISPGTIGVAQKISSDYRSKEVPESGKENSKLVFLTKNEVMSCGQNQY